MTCQKRYTCNLCRDEIHELTEGIGIRWNSGNHISNVILPDAETHLCNRCIEGLSDMFAAIVKDQEMYQRRDAER